MTREQFNVLAENAGRYADRIFEYYCKDGEKTMGFFMGIGVSEANRGRVILASCGYRVAIPFERVIFPKR
jgi:hypothetical protein